MSLDNLIYILVYWYSLSCHLLQLAVERLSNLTLAMIRVDPRTLSFTIHLLILAKGSAYTYDCRRLSSKQLYIWQTLGKYEATDSLLGTAFHRLR